MKDPASAQFRKTRYCDQAGPAAVVMGEVNGKNSYGAYSGFEGFFTDGVTVEMASQGGPLMTRCTEQLLAHAKRTRDGAMAVAGPKPAPSATAGDEVWMSNTIDPPANDSR